MTVHTAISALVTAVLIERRKKASSFVASPHVQTAVFEIPDIAAVNATRGETYSFILLGRTPAKASSVAVGDHPGFALTGEVLVVDGLHVAQGRQFCLEHRLINLKAVFDVYRRGNIGSYLCAIYVPPGQTRWNRIR